MRYAPALFATWFWSVRFRTKLLGLTATTAAVALLVSCIGLVGVRYWSERDLAQRRHAQIAQVITSNIGAALIFGDEAAANENLASVTGIKDIRWVTATLSSGRRIAEFPRAAVSPTASAGATETVSFPITVKGETIGVLQMGVHYLSFYDILIATAPTALILFILCLLIALSMAKGLNAVAFRPIDRLIKAMTEIGQSGDYNMRLGKDPDHDFDQIVSSFNIMLDEIATRNTALWDTAEELRHARDEAEHANAAKSQFIANMSHELRTPLNAIIGYTEVLREELTSAEMQRSAEDVEWIYSSARHLLNLINSILDFSKIEAGRSELDIHPVDMRKFMREVASILEPLAAQKDNRLHVELDATVDHAVTDSTKLRQCLLNLGGNACKFTKNGFIVITARSEGDDVLFTVSDTGIGMSPEEVARLFEPFVQADASTTRQFGGTGLGLAITARYAEMLEGSMAVESVKGEGSTFTLRIRRTLSEAPADTLEPLLPDIEGRVPAPLRSQRDRPLALVADDEPSAVDLFVRLVKANGYDAIVATNGDQCLEMARRYQPDIILLDLAMPRANGWAVLDQLRADVDLKMIPTVVVTVDDDRRRALLAGASDHLLKPVDRSELDDILSLYAERRSGNVLIVEDDPATARLYERGVRQMGFRTRTVSDGQAALDILAEEDFPFVVTDLGMPGLNGFALIEAISQIEVTRRPSVIVVSGRMLDEEDNQQLAGKVHSILSKSGLSPRKLARNLI